MDNERSQVARLTFRVRDANRCGNCSHYYTDWSSQSPRCRLCSRITPDPQFGICDEWEFEQDNH